MTDFELVFDNGGGILLQAENYCHDYYNNSHAKCSKPVCNCMQQLVEDIKALTEGIDPSEWQGNESEFRIEYDSQKENNGEYRWLYSADIINIINTVKTIEQRKEFFSNNVWGTAMREFWLMFFIHLYNYHGHFDTEESFAEICAEEISSLYDIDEKTVKDVLWDSWCNQPEPYDENLGYQEWIDYCQFVEETKNLAENLVENDNPKTLIKNADPFILQTLNKIQSMLVDKR